ncbi:hypothetical protein L1887_23451 [Cichorium endivia]|nr:hypothetical protein L1887_23451 [Cichorium endivia]
MAKEWLSNPTNMVLFIWIICVAVSGAILFLVTTAQDISKLRKSYSKNESYKRNERAPMMVVVLLLSINCFAQYALCGRIVGHKRSEIPKIGVAMTISVPISAPATAGIYTVLSPLGKDYDYDINASSDEESQ